MECAGKRFGASLRTAAARFRDNWAARVPLWCTALLLVAASRLLMVLTYGVWHRLGGQAASFFDAMYQFDCNWYAEIAQQGYRGLSAIHIEGGQAPWAFFPLFPYLAGAFMRLTGLSAQVAGVVLNTGILFLLTWAAGAYVNLLGGGRCFRFTAMLLLTFGPYSVYYSAFYSEALFGLLVCLFFYCMRKKWWLRMGLCGLLAGVTRNTGIFLVFAVLVYCVVEYRHGADGKTRSLPGFVRQVLGNPLLVLGVCLIPLGFFCHMLYLDHLVGDGMAFTHVMGSWSRTISNPVSVLFKDLLNLGSAGFYLALWGVMGLYLGCRALRRRPPEGVMACLLVLVPMCTMLDSMPRYMFCACPVLLEAADLLSGKGRLEKVFWYGFALLLGVITTWQWFAGSLIMM